jgi:hypothetical protein
MTHIYPLNDEQEHELEGTMCPCGPRLEFKHPVTGQVYPEALVIHNTFDFRHVVEEAEELIRNNRIKKNLELMPPSG